MKLVPALRIDGKIISGDEYDHHNTIAILNDLPEPDEKSRGFLTPDGDFITRKAAIMWLRKNEIKTFRRLPSKAYYNGLHSEDLAKARGITQRSPEEAKVEIKKAVTPKSIDLSDKTVLVWDRGLYLYLAEKLAQTYKKVYYYLPSSDPYPCSNLHNIATGIKNVERVHDYWDYVDKADLLVFWDCYDGDLVHFLRSKGYRVFGSGKGEKVETDKIFFMETLEKLGLPLPKTYLAEGIDDLVGYLKKQKGECWLKGLTRGDFETKRYRGMEHFEPWLDDLKRRLGKRVDSIEILVQDPINAECEVGYDGFCVDGEFTNNCIVGYEVKDKGFIASIQEAPPEIIKSTNDAFGPVFKELGFRGHYSTEIRITKDGTPYFIDPTCRVPSPPGELMSEFYINYAQIVWDVAEGKVPVPEVKHKYGAQVVLTSSWYGEDHEMFIEFPEKYKDNIKLSNFYRKGNKTYLVPNGTDEYFGSVIAIGDSVEEVTKKVVEILDTIDCDRFDYDHEVFSKAQEQIENGEKFGVEF